MSEESATSKVVTSESSNEAPVTAVDNFAAASQEQVIMDMVKSNPSLLNDPDIKNFIQSNNKTVSTKEQPSSKNLSQQETKSETNQSVDTKKESTKEEDSSSVFFKEMKEQEKINVKSFEDAIKAVQSKYSIDAEKDGGWSTFFSSVDKWRNDSQKATDLQKKVDEITQAFDNMPQPLFEAMKAWSVGEDYETAYQSNKGDKIDFSKDFNSQDVYKVVNHYFPNQFEKDDLDDKSDITIKRAIDLAQKQYNIDQENSKRQRANEEKSKLEKVQAFDNSIVSSVETLKKSFPNFSESHIKQIEKTLKSGDVNSLFFNSDLTYKSDAAEKIALMLFGKDEIIKVKNNTAKQTKSQVLEEVVSRGSDKINNTGNQTSVRTGSNTDLNKMFDGLIERRHY